MVHVQHARDSPSPLPRCECAVLRDAAVGITRREPRLKLLRIIEHNVYSTSLLTFVRKSLATYPLLGRFRQ